MNLHPIHTPIWAVLGLLWVAAVAAMLPRLADDRPDHAWLAAPWRAARWLLAGARWHRAARRAYAAGADLAAGWAMSAPVVVVPPWRDVPPPDGGNACHDGRRRCRECRLGGDCRTTEDPDARPAYAAGLPLPREGRHALTVFAAHWTHIDRLHQLRQSVLLAPGRYAARLGRPVALARRTVVLP